MTVNKRTLSNLLIATLVLAPGCVHTARKSELDFAMLESEVAPPATTDLMVLSNAPISNIGLLESKPERTVNAEPLKQFAVDAGPREMDAGLSKIEVEPEVLAKALANFNEETWAEDALRETPVAVIAQADLPPTVEVNDIDLSEMGLSLASMQYFAKTRIDTSGRVELDGLDVGAYASLREGVAPKSDAHRRSQLSESLIQASAYRTDQPNDSALNPVAVQDPVERLKFGVHLFREYKPLQPENMNLGLGNITVNNNSCGVMFLAEYTERIPSYPEPVAVAEPVAQVAYFEPKSWWDEQVINPTRSNAVPITLDVEALIVRTLQHSKYLQGLADLPVIREKSTMEAIAEFDTATFMETRFRRRSEPVGNTLTVGPNGSNRLRENDFTSSAGLSRKTTSGARVQMAQQVGLFNNNSTFIDPKRQGNSRLTLNVTQPLLSGSGRAYNTSLIMLAQMDERLAWDEVSEQLQDYLVEVTGAYWQLYLERARLEQTRQNLERAENILAELEHRVEIDAVESQLASARSAVHSRRSDLIRSRTLVRNVESRLRSLVNDPSLYGPEFEFVPTELPVSDRMKISMGDAMSQALESRSEIDKSIQKVRAAGVRLKIAKSELMPVMDLVLETYLSGLRGNDAIGQAWVDQFSVGEPSYSAGVRYELPWGNRLAKSRHDRRRLEMRQAISQFEFQIEELMSEVEIAVREVNTSYAEMLSRQEAMSAARTDLQYFMQRWELLPGDDRSASFLLEDILAGQDRLAAAESNYAQTQINYTMSIVKLKRSLGILMKTERIEAVQECEVGLPRYIFEKDSNVLYQDEMTMLPFQMQGGDSGLEEPVPGEIPFHYNSDAVDDGDHSIVEPNDYTAPSDWPSTLVPYTVDSTDETDPATLDSPVRFDWEQLVEEQRMQMESRR